jgi:hypothetical protein
MKAEKVIPFNPFGLHKCLWQRSLSNETVSKIVYDMMALVQFIFRGMIINKHSGSG